MRRGWAVLLSCAFAACSSDPESPPAASRFRVELAWAAEVPADGRVWLHVRVEERPDDPTASGLILAAARPVEWRAGLSIPFDSVPDGEDRVVIVEARETELRSAPLVYFGLSAPFALTAGADLAVQVELGTVPVIEGMSVEVLNAVEGRVSTAALQLRVVATRADRIDVAQDPGFTFGAVRLAAADLAVGMSSGGVVYEVPYDLDANLDCETGVCVDGPRRVFVRGVGAVEGAESGLASTLVILDRGTVPIISDLTVAPARVGPGATVTATFTLSEAVPAARIDARIAGEPMTCEAVPAPPANAYACTYTVPTGSAETETLEDVVITVADEAGNADAATKTVIFDLVPPRLVDGSVSQVLVSGPSNVLGTELQAVGVGATAKLQFAVAERLAAAPEVTGVVDGNRVPLALEDQVGLSYVFEYVVTESSPEGTYAVEVRLEDLAGNSTTVNDPTLDFTVDATVPSPPDVDADDRVVFIRRPWGTTTSSHTPDFALQGAAGAAEPGAVVRVLHPLLGEVARTSVDSAGAFEVTGLGIPDATTLSVQTIDPAGNASPIVAVRNGRWIAGFGGKVPGRSAPNPHLVAAVGDLSPTRMQRGRELSAVEYGALTHGAGPLAAPAIQRWENATYVPTMSPRGRLAAAYHASRGTIVAFGGEDGEAMGDTWTWDGLTWRDASPPLQVAPNPRFGMAMAYHAARDRVVLFGGYDETSHFGDTWEWDGDVWTQVSTSGPSPREGHAMVYDEDRGVVVMYGGKDATSTLNETWEYDGGWQQVTPTCTPSPCPLDAYFGMAYDPGQQQVVRFSGENGRRDTWLYDGTAWTRAAATSPPSIRVGSQMAFDRQRNRVLLYGGIRVAPSGPDTYLDDLWVWDGASQTWTRDSTPGGPLPPRGHHALVYADITQETVVIAGQIDQFAYTDSASANQTGRWLPVTQLTGPTGRAGPAMTTAPDGRVFMFGGEPEFVANIKLKDAWLFDGRIWSQLSTPNLTSRVGATAVLDANPNRNRVLVFGGESDFFATQNTLQVFDGRLWPAETTGGLAARLQHGMAYDPTADLVVVFGGQAEIPSGGVAPSNDTYTFNPFWTRVPTAMTWPSPRLAMAMTYDPRSGDVLMFGGGDFDSGVFGDTWAFNVPTRTWRQLSPSRSPTPRIWGQMVYSPDRDRVVLFGGVNLNLGRQFSDTWEWDGMDWHEVTTSQRPPPKQYHGLAYGGADGNIVTFGDIDADSDTWRLRNPALVRPGMLAVIDWSAANVPASAIQNVQIALNAGADGGAELRYWRPQTGRWTALASNTAPPTAPAPLSAQLDSADGPAAILRGESLSLVVQAGVTLGARVAPPEVVFDDLQVEVQYRTP